MQPASNVAGAPNGANRLLLGVVASLSVLFLLREPAEAVETGQCFLQHAQGNSGLEFGLIYRDSDQPAPYAFNHHSTQPVETRAVQGLSLTQLDGSGQHVSFRIPRDAGTFSCDGWAASGTAAGRFTFSPNATFNENLARRGIGVPTERQSLELALGDVGLPFFDQLAKQGYSHPTVDSVLALSRHGTGWQYIKDMAALGYGSGSLESLMRLRDRSVGADFIAAAKAAGLNHLTVDDLIRLRDHGVSARYLQDLGGSGYRLSVDDLLRLRDHGVTGSYIKRLQRYGYKSLSVEDLIRLRDNGI